MATDTKTRESEIAAASPAQAETEKCANHPDRDGTPVDFGGVTLNLCSACSAFKDA